MCFNDLCIIVKYDGSSVRLACELVGGKILFGVVNIFQARIISGTYYVVGKVS